MTYVGSTFLAFFGLIGFAFVVAGLIHAGLYWIDRIEAFAAAKLAQEASSHDTYGDWPAVSDDFKRHAQGDIL